MTFINRLFSSVPITTQEPQSEATSPPQNESSFGIAGSTDSFETTVLNNFELQQLQDISVLQPPPELESSIDAASMFLDISVPQQPDRITELSQRLEMVRTQKEDLTKQLKGTEEKKMELNNAAEAIDHSLENDEPISEQAASVLQGLGVFGVIGGALLGLPIISTIGGLVGGLSTAYKEKLKEAQREIDRQKAENDENSQAITSKTDALNIEEQSVLKLLEEEKRRLEQGFDERTFNPKLLTVETPWEESIPTDSVIQNNETAVLFNSDIKKTIGEE